MSVRVYQLHNNNGESNETELSMKNKLEFCGGLQGFRLLLKYFGGDRKENDYSSLGSISGSPFSWI